jgi:hypothetical protein
MSTLGAQATGGPGSTESSRGEPIDFGDSLKRVPSKIIAADEYGFPQMLRKIAENPQASQNPVNLNYQLSASQRPLDDVSDIERGLTISICLLHHAVSHTANFFRGLLRSNIIFADIKDHALNKLEGVIKH